MYPDRIHVKFTRTFSLGINSKEIITSLSLLNILKMRAVGRTLKVTYANDGPEPLYIYIYIYIYISRRSPLYCRSAWGTLLRHLVAIGVRRQVSRTGPFYITSGTAVLRGTQYIAKGVVSVRYECYL
jgi:hypothetical protein